MSSIEDLREIVRKNDAYVLKMTEERPYPAKAIAHCTEQTRLIKALIEAKVYGDSAEIQAAEAHLESWGKVYATACMLGLR
jgi:chorismate mutase